MQRFPFIPFRRWDLPGLLWILTWVLIAPSHPLTAQIPTPLEQKRADDAVLLDGLRKRRLFEVAKFYCLEQLDNPAIDPTSQSTLIIELMKTQTNEAVLASANTRTAIWKTVDTTSSEFLRQHPQHPRRFLIQVQQALSHLAHGRLLSQELDAEMAEESARPAALEEIKHARTLLNTLQRAITNEIPNQRSRTLTEHDLTSEHLLNLKDNIQYQLALCNLSRAQLYDPSDRLNRIDALNSVSQRLDEVQRTTTEGQPLWWKTRLGQIECFRLLGALKNARRLADSLNQIKAPVATRQLLLEQKARLAVRLDDPKYVQTVLTEFNQIPSRSAQLELAIIELAVNLSARASSEDKQQEWILFASQLSKSVGQTRGGYWGRRADLILISATGIAHDNTSTLPTAKRATNGSSNSVSENTRLNLLIRLAEEAARKNQLGDALKAYDRATELALSIKDMQQALQMDYLAGKLLEQQSQHAQAAKRMITAATRDPKQPFAPSAHLIGCWNFAKTIGDQQPTQRQAFETLLQDHLKRWRSDASSNQIRIWLAGELQFRKQWESAFNIYLNVSSDSSLFGTAVQQAGRCARRALADKQTSATTTQQLTSQLVAKLESVSQSVPPDSPTASSIALTRIELDFIYGTQQPDEQLASLLVPLESSKDPATAEAAKALHAVAICLKEPAKAQQLIDEIGENESALALGERCLASLVGNPQLASQTSELNRCRLSLINRALASAAIQTPAGATQTTWKLKQSSVLNSLGKHAESIAVLSELEKQFPRNADVQMQLARAMSRQYGKSDPAQPLKKWRRIAARLRPQTPNWFEAKYEVARLLFESGDAPGALKLLKYLKANPPGWETSTWKPKFESLLQQLQKSP